MNKTLLLAGIATTLLAANVNAAEYTPYASAKLSYAKTNVDYSQLHGTTHRSSDLDDKIWGAKLAVGVATPVAQGAVRTELEYGFSQTFKADFTDAETRAEGGSAKMKGDIDTYMLNAYYDIDTGTKFTPYVGAGIGIAHIKAQGNVDFNGVRSSDFSKSKNNFAWQIGAGASYAVNDKVSIDAGYRYTDAGNVKGTASFTGDDKPSIKTKTDMHEILLGARYAF